MPNAKKKPYKAKAMNEQQAAEFREMLVQMKREIGDEAFLKLTLELAEEYEDMLRERFPDNPALEMLDRHRERESSRRA